MDSISQKNGLADAQRRLQELRDEEARQLTERRADEDRTKEADRKENDRSASPDKQADNRKADDIKEDGRLEDDHRKQDDRLQDSRLDADRRKEDDRKNERKSEERNEDRREQSASNEVTAERADYKPEQSQSSQEDNSLNAQVARMKEGDVKTEMSASRPATGNVLNPNDLANQERQQNTPRPSSERADSAQITPGAANAEREHLQQGRQNQVAERTEMRNSLEREKNASQGNTRPSAETQEFAAKAEGRLEQESAKSQARVQSVDAAKKPELTR